MIERAAKISLISIERLAHAQVLRSLPREQEGDRPRFSVCAGLLVGQEAVERFGHLVAVGADSPEAPIEMMASAVRGEAHVAQLGRVCGGQCRAKIGDLRGERRLGFARKRQAVERSAARRSRRRGRRLFEHDEGVCPAHADRVDPGAARRGSGRKRLCPGVDKKRRAFERDARIGVGIVQARGDQAAVQRQHCLDQSGEPGALLKVTEIRFDRADRAKLGTLGSLAKGTRQRLDLERIAERGRGAVALDKADTIGRDIGERHRLGHGAGLGRYRRRGVVDLQRAVIGDRGALDDCVDAIAIRHRRRQRLQYHGRDATAE